MGEMERMERSADKQLNVMATEAEPKPPDQKLKEIGILVETRTGWVKRADLQKRMRVEESLTKKLDIASENFHSALEYMKRVMPVVPLIFLGIEFTMLIWTGRIASLNR